MNKEPFAFVAVACFSAFIAGILLILWQSNGTDSLNLAQNMPTGLSEHFGGADVGCLYGKVMVNRESLRITDKRIHPAFLGAVSVLERPSSDIRVVIAGVGEYNFAIMDWEAQFQTLYFRMNYLKYVLDSNQWMPKWAKRKELYRLCEGTRGIMEGEAEEHLQESNTIWFLIMQRRQRLQLPLDRSNIRTLASLVARPEGLFLA